MREAGSRLISSRVFRVLTAGSSFLASRKSARRKSNWQFREVNPARGNNNPMHRYSSRTRERTRSPTNDPFRSARGELRASARARARTYSGSLPPRVLRRWKVKAGEMTQPRSRETRDHEETSAVRSRRPGRIRNGRSSFTSSAYTSVYAHVHIDRHPRAPIDRSRCDTT